VPAAVVFITLAPPGDSVWPLAHCGIVDTALLQVTAAAEARGGRGRARGRHCCGKCHGRSEASGHAGESTVEAPLERVGIGCGQLAATARIAGFPTLTADLQVEDFVALVVAELSER
jgi:hypothetical protein